jgi:hypothetical protein
VLRAPKAAVEPFPKHVEEDLGAADLRVVQREADADVRDDVLSPVEGDLELRYERPVGGAAAL